jgi:hypothetical protein
VVRKSGDERSFSDHMVNVLTTRWLEGGNFSHSRGCGGRDSLSDDTELGRKGGGKEKLWVDGRLRQEEVKGGGGARKATGEVGEET